jgi:hypothetical protein
LGILSHEIGVSKSTDSGGLFLQDLILLKKPNSNILIEVKKNNIQSFHSRPTQFRAASDEPLRIAYSKTPELSKRFKVPTPNTGRQASSRKGSRDRGYLPCEPLPNTTL